MTTLSPTSTPDTGGASAANLDVSLVVTIFNESATLEELHRRSVEALEALGRPFEILYVDDGSTDGTFDLLAALQAGDARVRVVRLTRNSGQHPAMHAGLSRARGSILVTMDGDLQNLPEDIGRLVAAIDDGDGRGQRQADGEGRLLGADAPVAPDQRHAPAVHRRRDLRLRMRVQRVPS